MVEEELHPSAFERQARRRRGNSREQLVCFGGITQAEHQVRILPVVHRDVENGMRRQMVLNPDLEGAGGLRRDVRGTPDQVVLTEKLAEEHRELIQQSVLHMERVSLAERLAEADPRRTGGGASVPRILRDSSFVPAQGQGHGGVDIAVPGVLQEREAIQRVHPAIQGSQGGPVHRRSGGVEAVSAEGDSAARRQIMTTAPDLQVRRRRELPASSIFVLRVVAMSGEERLQLVVQSRGLLTDPVADGWSAIQGDSIEPGGVPVFRGANRPVEGRPGPPAPGGRTLEEPAGAQARRHMPRAVVEHDAVRGAPGIDKRRVAVVPGLEADPAAARVVVVVGLHSRFAAEIQQRDLVGA